MDDYLAAADDRCRSLTCFGDIDRGGFAVCWCELHVFPADLVWYRTDVGYRASEQGHWYGNRLKVKYRDLLRVWESDWGCSDGWNVELNGEVVAMMDEPRGEDMFWVSYHVTPTTLDPLLAPRLVSEEFWKDDDNWPKLTFRSRATGFVAENAMPSIQPIVGRNRVNMRGLYISIRHPLPWDWLLLRIRRMLRRRSRSS
jgi:hypothetical protein